MLNLIMYVIIYNSLKSSNSFSFPLKVIMRYNLTEEL